MFKQLTNLFKQPSPAELAQAELERAERELLAAQSALEFAKSVVAYNNDRIERLRAVLRCGDVAAYVPE